MQKAILFLAAGDRISEEAKKEAEKAGFSGEIITFSEEEARAQRTPLPLLVVDTRSYGPISVRDYFRSHSHLD